MPVTQKLTQLMDLTFLLFSSQEKTWKRHSPRSAEKIRVLLGDCQPPGMSNTNDKLCVSLS